MCAEPKRSIWRLAGIACALLLIAALWPGVHPALAQDDEEEVEGDVLFLFDTTTGMADFLVTAHADAEDLLDALADRCNPGFAVAQYRDWPPEDNLPWHLVQDVTLDRPAAVNAINLLFPDGGGDRPDSVAWALHSSLGISWHEDAVKVIVLVGGAPSHDPDPGADGVYGTDDDLLFADAVSELVAADAKVIGLYTDDSLDTLAYWNGVTEATTGKKATRLRFPDELSRILKDTVCQTIEEAEIEPPPAAPGGSLRGTVFHDANRNGLWDAEEGTLPGIPVTVYSPTWEATAYSGDDGTYGVVALAPSWWGVRIAVPDGWQATTPADRWGYLITELGTVYFGLNFGLTTAEAEEVAREEAVDEEPTGKEAAPFILPITGHAAPAGYLWLIAVGLALAAAGLAAIRALRGQGSS
jgi:hypothetical protein